jgi:AcrR family transcriptional regulator/predicted secreted hydrolase
MNAGDESSTPGAATRQALIEAGSSLFGRAGFHATSTRSLAEAAGVKQALIGFHFGGKEGLYLAVCEHIAEELHRRLMLPAESMQELKDVEGTPDAAAVYLEAIGRMTDLMVDATIDPELEPWARLMLQEQLTPHSAFDRIFDRLMAPHFAALTKLVSRLRPHHSETENKLTVIMLIGQVLAFRPARSAILKHMNWSEFGPDQAETIKASIRTNVALQLTAVNSPPNTAKERAMTLKTDAPNLGIPMFVEPRRDLLAKPQSPVDSWYVNCNFRVGERELGFEWHQMVTALGPGKQITRTEFLLMDASRRIWLDHASEETVAGDIGAATDRCRVTSSFGSLAGDRDRLTLNLHAPDGAVDMVLKPKEQVLYNGTVGMIPLLGSCFQYAFPNMSVEGTIRLNDETLDVGRATAWLDRQWAPPALPAEFNFEAFGGSWVWLGMTLNPEGTAAISLWDLVEDNGRRHAFATILDANGVQSNHSAAVTYGGVWQSERTGNSYPSTVSITIPSADLALSLNALLERPEFSHGRDRRSFGGCQSPCAVRGHYGSIPIDRVVILEMIGDVCKRL